MTRARPQKRIRSAPRRTPRHVTDAHVLAQVWVDAGVIGVSAAARAHDMDRVTVRSIRARVDASPELLALAHEKQARMAERVEQARLQAELSLYAATTRTVAGATITPAQSAIATELVDAAGALARIRGEHKGDASQASGGGRRPTLIVPSVLVQERPDDGPTEAPGPPRRAAPESDPFLPSQRTIDR